jgi:hypothetical protein
MTDTVVIVGFASRVMRFADTSAEGVIREVVREALAQAQLETEEIDTLVTVGSDALDGGMVAGRSGVAGSYGKSLLTVPSSAGHALGAASAMIQGGGASKVLLVGWGEGSNFAEVDGRIIQADPFYARPLGAGAAEMAVLQAQRLFATGRFSISELDRFGETMRSRSIARDSSSEHRVPVPWLSTSWCDGACALVLTSSSGGVGSPGPISIEDFGSSFQPYSPEPEELDPSRWVAAAQAAMRRRDADELESIRDVEICGPTCLVEMLAATELLSTLGWDSSDLRVNPSGGGALAYFGPATGLRSVVSACSSLRAATSLSSRAVVIDLGGPIGQASTVVWLASAA